VTLFPSRAAVSKIKKLVETGLNDNIYSSLQIAVSHKNVSVLKIKLGQNYLYFDLASVTKMVVTTPLIVRAIKDKKISLNSHLGAIVHGFCKGPVAKLKISSLLDQTSGLVWWRPYFKALQKFPLTERSYILKKTLAKERMKSSGKCVYSDLNFIFLQWVLEEVYQAPLDILFKRLLRNNQLNIRILFRC
jgi:CubicO group peptidase (beta-lactamase class C family)